MPCRIDPCSSGDRTISACGACSFESGRKAVAHHHTPQAFRGAAETKRFEALWSVPTPPAHARHRSGLAGRAAQCGRRIWGAEASPRAGGDSMQRRLVSRLRARCGRPAPASMGRSLSQIDQRALSQN